MFHTGLSAISLCQTAKDSMLVYIAATTFTYIMSVLQLQGIVPTLMASMSVTQLISALLLQLLKLVTIVSPLDLAAATFLFLMSNVVQAMESGSYSASYMLKY